MLRAQDGFSGRIFKSLPEILRRVANPVEPFDFMFVWSKAKNKIPPRTLETDRIFSRAEPLAQTGLVVRMVVSSRCCVFGFNIGSHPKIGVGQYRHGGIPLGAYLETSKACMETSWGKPPIADAPLQSLFSWHEHKNFCPDQNQKPAGAPMLPGALDQRRPNLQGSHPKSKVSEAGQHFFQIPRHA